MEKLIVKDITDCNVDALVRFCVPADKTDDPLFVAGIRIMKRWAEQVIESYGCLGKLAYVGPKAVGMVQALPNPEERLVQIECIFVPDEENQRKGVGKALLKALIDDTREPESCFGGDTPLALVTTAFTVPGRYPQHEFYRRMGFKRARAEDAFLLYYPLEEGFVYVPEEEPFSPQEEDEGRALIFYKPSCPFCMYYAEAIRKSIEEIRPDVPVRMVNRFEEADEVRLRGSVPACVVNKKPIESFFLDKAGFQSEVKEALEPGGKPR